MLSRKYMFLVLFKYFSQQVANVIIKYLPILNYRTYCGIVMYTKRSKFSSREQYFANMLQYQIRNN